MISQTQNMEGFIDRKVEQEIFTKLLSLKDKKRLLTIQDAAGMGKSHLLRQLKYKCMWETPARPVSLVIFGEKDAVRDEWTLIELIRKDFGQSKIMFKKFDKLNKARILKNPDPFEGIDVGHVDARESQITQSEVVGTKYENIQAQTFVATQKAAWFEGYEKIAQKECIDAFFEDLKMICEQCEQPLVILFDSWEKCNKDLQDWILINMLRNWYCFDDANRPDKLVIVLAGDEIPDFKRFLGLRYQELVTSIESLSEWELDHVKDFLKAHQYERLDESEIQVIYNRIKKGMTLQTALNIAKFFNEGG